MLMNCTLKSYLRFFCSKNVASFCCNYNTFAVDLFKTHSSCFCKSSFTSYSRSTVKFRSIMALLTAPEVSFAKTGESLDDCLVIVGSDVANVCSLHAELGNELQKYAEINKKVESDVSVLRVDKHPFRVVYSPTGPLNRDYDDIRRIYDAARKGVQKALQAGSKRPHVTVAVPDSFFGKTTSLVACLGALNPFYVPLLTRERIPDCKQKCERLSFDFQSMPLASDELLNLASKLDAARWVFRDIGGSDPERMTPGNIVDYVRNLFPAGKSPVKMEVISGQAKFEQDYPLFAAVNRAVADIPKHAGHIVYLEYTGEGEIEQSVYLVGKGVVYDTGGHDLKTDGHMIGMHRDKCGAATVAGIFKFLHDTKPRGIHVVGAMALVRNEISPTAYVADEIITARSGVRVIITNTDAEGRMAMADLLCEMKERALARAGKDPKLPQLFTIATLTGHEVIAYGDGYSAVMENGPARKLCTGRKLQAMGEALVDPFEISNLRRDDYDKHRCPNEYGDVLQCVGKGPSSRNPRGHQCPGAFLIIASGLEAHGNDSSKPLAYCHLDIAGGTGDWLETDPPNPAAMNALIGSFVLPKLSSAAILDSASKCC